MNVKVEEISTEQKALGLSAHGNENSAKINAEEADDQKKDGNVQNDAYKVEEVSDKKNIGAEEALIKKIDCGLVRNPPEVDTVVHMGLQ